MSEELNVGKQEGLCTWDWSAWERAFEMAEAGRSAEEIAEETGRALSVVQASLKAIRTKQLAPYEVSPRLVVNACLPLLKPRWRRLMRLHLSGLKQADVASKMNCSQGTVAKVVQKFNKEMAFAETVLVESGHSFKSRLRIWVHRQSDWDKVAAVDFGPAQEAVTAMIAEAKQFQVPDVFIQTSLCEEQLDKLVMDIVLALQGQCVVVADTTLCGMALHLVYFLCDCVKTRDFVVEECDFGFDNPWNLNIWDIQRWFDALQVKLSTNELAKLKNVISWYTIFSG